MSRVPELNTQPTTTHPQPSTIDHRALHRKRRLQHQSRYAASLTKPISSVIHHRPINTKKDMTVASLISRRRDGIANRMCMFRMPTPALVTLLVFIGLMLRYLSSSMSYSSATSSCIHGQDRTWHGGHPAEDRPGQCWCGGDEYCMCTPSVAIDVVLYSKRKQGDEIDVWAVRRGDTGQLATIGG